MPTPNRLIWFQHFHKAAGTTIVEHAKRAGEVFYFPHNNGNPVGEDGDSLRVWEYEENQLLQFVDTCRRRGITFLATEWGLPEVVALSRRPGVVLVTALRDPYSRFVSNYLFDYRHGFTNHRNVRDYVDSKGPFSGFNYYCRILTGKHDSALDLGHEDLAMAMEKLRAFQNVALTDQPDGVKALIEGLGWRYYPIRRNTGRVSPRTLLGHVWHGKFELALRHIRAKPATVDPDFKRFFDAHNQLDNQLVELIRPRPADTRGISRVC